MLQGKKGESTVKFIGFLVGVEIEEGLTTVEYVGNALADACKWIQGVGDTSVECLGEIEIVNEDEIDIIEDMKES